MGKSKALALVIWVLGIGIIYGGARWYMSAKARAELGAHPLPRVFPIKTNLNPLKPESGMAKLNINPRLLVSENPKVQSLNPRLHLKNMADNDPRLQQLQLPKGVHFLAIRDPKCPAVPFEEGLGLVKMSSISQKNWELGFPSTFSYVTERPQTVEALARSVAKNPCLLKVQVNASLQSIALAPGITNYRPWLDPKTHGAPPLLASKDILKLSQKFTQDMKARGQEGSVDVYNLGRFASQFKVSELRNPTEPIPIPALSQMGTSYVTIPMPSNTESENQLADLNNTIFAAVARGARMILVPAIDPNTILTASRYAESNGARVYLVPNGITSKQASNR